jgi:RNA polymerase sigma factor (sigma-70 family)
VANGQLKHALQQIRSLVAGAAAGQLPDQELLERFVRHADEAAFAALVQRHGPMVLRVCHRVLHDAHDAEDAWQATFLVLARKATSVRKQASIGSWLHGVAFHTAANLRRHLTRRQARERATADRSPAANTETTWREVQLALDEELQRLPEQLRAPLLLCYLEGKTRDEAARELGWSPGTLRGRLQRGRDRLRHQLNRRGLTLSSALLAALVSQDAMPAALPPSFEACTVKAATRTVTGQAVAGLVSTRVVTLVEGALQAMKTKQKIAALLLIVGFVVLGAGLIYSQPLTPAGGKSNPSPLVQPGAHQVAVPDQEQRQVLLAQADADQPRDLADMVALAEKDVAIKRAAVKVANAQKIMAEAKVRILKSKALAAQAAEKGAKTKLDRVTILVAQKAVEPSLADEAQVKYLAALALRQESEDTIALGEAEVGLELARREVAEAELDKADLRLKQLRDRLTSKK